MPFAMLIADASIPTNQWTGLDKGFFGAMFVIFMVGFAGSLAPSQSGGKSSHRKLPPVLFFIMAMVGLVAMVGTVFDNRLADEPAVAEAKREQRTALRQYWPQHGIEITFVDVHHKFFEAEAGKCIIFRADYTQGEWKSFTGSVLREEDGRSRLVRLKDRSQPPKLELPPGEVVFTDAASFFKGFPYCNPDKTG